MAEHPNDAAPTGSDAPWPTMFPRDDYDGARPPRDGDTHDSAHHDGGGDRADEADAGRHRSGRSGTADDASPCTGSGP